MAKYLLIAAIVISLVTAGIGFVNHQTLVDTKTKLDQTQTTLTATQGNLTKTSAELKTTKATLEATEAEKVKLATDLTSTQGELATTKTSLADATKAGTEKDAKIAQLQSDNDELNRKIAQIGGGGPDPSKGIEVLQQHVQEVEAALASTQDQLKSTKAQLADFQDKEKQRQEGLMQKGLEGRVLAVNPAWNFVVLSIGDKQGVSNNAELLLKRGGQYLGKVRVTSVEPSTSIADIVANTLPPGVAVQPGDSVIFVGTEKD